MRNDHREPTVDGGTVTDFESGTMHEAVEVRVPGSTILYHPDLGRVGEQVLFDRLTAGHGVELSRVEPLFAQPGSDLRRGLADSRLSRRPLLIEPDGSSGGIRLRCGESRTSVIIDGSALAMSEQRELTSQQIENGVVLLLGGVVVLLLHLIDPYLPVDLPQFGLLGESPGMHQVRREIQQLADLQVPVLVRGASGTGKELVARAIHEAGPRRGQPYIAVNIAAVPASLAAAELFGAVRGAYTGADRRHRGYFEQARGGTLFLDEIGEAPAEIQVHLLRALETGEVQPVGAEASQAVDVRVVSATDADLEVEATEARFRAPLLYRLSGFTLRLPSLRERREDLGRLLVHFLRQELETAGEARRLEPARHPWLPAPVVAELAGYDWPGNVRQLRNVVRQLVISHRGEERVRAQGSIQRLLGESLVSVSWPGDRVEASPATKLAGETPRRPLEIGSDELVAALRANRWQLKATADHLGISRPSLYDLIERCDQVRLASELEPAEILAVQDRCAGEVAAMADALEVSVIGLRRRMAQLGL